MTQSSKLAEEVAFDAQQAAKLGRSCVWQLEGMGAWSEKGNEGCRTLGRECVKLPCKRMTGYFDLLQPAMLFACRWEANTRVATRKIGEFCFSTLLRAIDCSKEMIRT